MGSGLYEMVPGFIAATVAIVLVSKLDREPPEELQVRHQQVRASLHESGYCCSPGPASPCAPAARPCTTPSFRRTPCWGRSAERLLGKECVRTSISRWSRYLTTK